MFLPKSTRPKSQRANRLKKKKKIEINNHPLKGGIMKFKNILSKFHALILY
jgi:hypothetical protein